MAAPEMTLAGKMNIVPPCANHDLCRESLPYPLSDIDDDIEPRSSIYGRSPQPGLRGEEIPMPFAKFFTAGILEPDELQALQSIYNEIVAEPWFDKGDLARQVFASRLLNTYQEGLTDFPRLRRFMILHAAEHFAKDRPAIVRTAPHLTIASHRDKERWRGRAFRSSGTSRAFRDPWFEHPDRAYRAHAFD